MLGQLCDIRAWEDSLSIIKIAKVKSRKPKKKMTRDGNRRESTMVNEVKALGKPAMASEG